MVTVTGFSGCQMRDKNGKVSKSSIQTIDLGEFNGLRIIEFASLNYSEAAVQTHTNFGFTEFDKENFSDSLYQSLQNSGVSVLPSAQTKIHIHFTRFAITEDTKDIIVTINADVSVSRNGIFTRKSIKINSKTIDSKKDNAIKKFIQKLGEMLREQSPFKG
jgi:hypothetical protein